VSSAACDDRQLSCVVLLRNVMSLTLTWCDAVRRRRHWRRRSLIRQWINRSRFDARLPVRLQWRSGVEISLCWTCISDFMNCFLLSMVIIVWPLTEIYTWSWSLKLLAQHVIYFTTAASSNKSVLSFVTPLSWVIAVFVQAPNPMSEPIGWICCSETKHCSAHWNVKLYYICCKCSNITSSHLANFRLGECNFATIALLVHADRACIYAEYYNADYQC